MKPASAGKRSFCSAVRPPAMRVRSIASPPVISPSAARARDASSEPCSCHEASAAAVPRSAGHAIVSASIQCARSSPVPASGGSLALTVRTWVARVVPEGHDLAGARREGDVATAGRSAGTVVLVPLQAVGDLHLVRAGGQVVGRELEDAVGVAVEHHAGEAVRRPVSGASELALERSGQRDDGAVIGRSDVLRPRIEVERDRTAVMGERDVAAVQRLRPLRSSRPISSRWRSCTRTCRARGCRA